MMIGAPEQFPEIMALPPTDMLGYLRSVEHYSVRLLASEQRSAASMTRYLISAASFAGAEVAVHVQLCVYDASDRRLVLSIPGGGGVFREDTTWWLAQHFKQNYAAIDWIGRGRSPEHPHLRCDYDPIYMAEDDVRDSYTYHNVAALWAALNWLFHIGYQPTDIIGGSWGGVFCYLLAALEPRIKRIFPTFGCGGMSFQGVEKRSMWDAAIQEMGPDRTLRWREAFDPMLRMSDITARTYYETATNDKFFSLDMAMATWRRVRNPYFLSLAANQDHTMNPFGTQPYVVQQVEEDLLSECEAISRIQPISSPQSGEVTIHWSGRSDGSTLILCWSEQRAANGHMSREWHFARPECVGSDAAVFRLRRSHVEADILYFATCLLPIKGITVRASTGICTAGVSDLVEPHAASRVALLEAEGDPWLAPIGDKVGPAVQRSEGGWAIRFARVPRARITRFGIRPWLVPPCWRSIDIVLAEPVDPAVDNLELILSRRYQRNDEEAVAHAFRDATTSRDGRLRRLRFERADFVGSVVVEERFRRRSLPSAEAVIDNFDAIGIMDRLGRFDGVLTLVKMSIDTL